jgi:hypothetical protein
MSGHGSDVRDNLATARELLTFMWQGRIWWLTPIVVLILLLSILTVFLESSAVAPFIYTLF